MLPDSVAAIEVPPLSDEVREFCERHALFGHLAKALELAHEYFTIVGEPVINWEHDPDNDDEYVLIEVWTRGSSRECAKADWRYAGAWTQFAKLPEVRLIRFVPHSC